MKVFDGIAYVISSADDRSGICFTNSGNITVYLPPARGLAGFFTALQATGGGTITLNAGTGPRGIPLVNGAASITLAPGGGGDLYLGDDGNWCIATGAASIGGGSVKLASGTITGTPEFIDISLPSGYEKYKLSVLQYNFSVTDSIALAMSFNNGGSFINDASNFDSYFNNQILCTAGTVSGSGIADALCQIGFTQQGVNQSTLGTVEVEIIPGGSNSFAYCITSGFNVDNSPTIVSGTNTTGVNPAATVTPATGRVNLIRILPYGNGDCNPPTSGHTFARGSWLLTGTPTS